MRVFTGALVLAAGLVGLAAPAQAASSPEWDACNGSEPQYTLAQQISGCTSIIESGAERNNNERLAAAYYNRGLTYKNRGDYDLAISDYDRAIELTPNDPECFVARGVAYHTKGQYDRAITDYDRAIALKPDYALAFNNRGIAKRKKGDRSGGDADVATAQALDPKAGYK